MSDYQEILTDLSYCQQIVTMTAPQIGNYAVDQDEIELKHIQLARFIVRGKNLNAFKLAVNSIY